MRPLYGVVPGLLMALAAHSAPVSQPAPAQDPAAALPALQVLDLKGNPTDMPGFGQKNLLIFYVDPDHPWQNDAFVRDMEANSRVSGDNLLCYGVLNLKDAPLLPNSVVCRMTAKRTAKNHALVLADPDRRLATNWRLGNCNNKFTIFIVSREGRVVFLRKGEFTRDDMVEFYRVVQDYR